VGITYHVTARIHHERFRGLQGLDFFQQEQTLLAALDPTRRWHDQNPIRALNLSRQGGNPGQVSGALGSKQRLTGKLSAQAPHGDPRNNQLMHGPQCQRKRPGIQVTHGSLDFIEMSEQQLAPGFEITGVRSVSPIAVRLEDLPSLIQHLRRPTEIARYKRNLGLSYHTARAGNRLFRAEGTRSAADECARPHQIAQLRHRDASQRKRRGVIA